ncbi:hypothetical protein F441_07115 [Phytophthora nicotianae CJ01A1]|uniref:Integrase catalytic domain-containing protein n=1 Tax=Phytophthora nicotianae CJ01A1 TaxID=1317063 RepID=W2X7B5_PHYNI|nr:hypothetical protein F441_07115 [Phytophthora nicotianae CJ01A1]
MPHHTAQDVAGFVVERLVFAHEPMREIVMDGAPELNGKIVEELRFHRTWKDMVSIYTTEGQDDWDRRLPCAACAYHGARHSDAERATEDERSQPFAGYHRRLVSNMEKATRAARAAIARDQVRRERYYNKRVRQATTFKVRDLVWVLRPPRGQGVTKLAHRWVGPAKIVQSAGFDNWEVVREDNGERMVVPCSFLVSSRCSSNSLGVVADRILAELAAKEDETEERDGGTTMQQEPLAVAAATGREDGGGERRDGEQRPGETGTRGPGVGGHAGSSSVGDAAVVPRRSVCKEKRKRRVEPGTPAGGRDGQEQRLRYDDGNEQDRRPTKRPALHDEQTATAEAALGADGGSRVNGGGAAVVHGEDASAETPRGRETTQGDGEQAWQA